MNKVSEKITIPSFICMLVNSSQNSFWVIILCGPRNRVIQAVRYYYYYYYRCGNGGSRGLWDLPKMAWLRSCWARARVSFPWILLSFCISLILQGLLYEEQSVAFTCMKAQEDSPLSCTLSKPSRLSLLVLSQPSSVITKPPNSGSLLVYILHQKTFPVLPFLRAHISLTVCVVPLDISHVPSCHCLNDCDKMS